jgi:DNA-binding NarL/FixJ family response regulator
MKQFSLLVVDDHDLFRAGIALIINQNFPVAVVSTYAGLGEAFDSCDSPPDILLLDFNLKGVGGEGAISLVQAHWPSTALAVVTAETDPHTLERIRAIPEVMLLSKTAPASVLVNLVRECLPECASAQVIGSLSNRQLEILRHMREGHSNKSIARLVGLSEFTVRGHVQRIFKVTGASNRTSAVFLAEQTGLL